MELVYFFGGWNIINVTSGVNSTVSFFNDTQIYHAATSSWESLTSVGPAGRKSAGGARIGSNFYIFGGVGADPVNAGLRFTYSDMWQMSISDIGNNGVTNTVSLFTIFNSISSYLIHLKIYIHYTKKNNKFTLILL